MIGAMIREYKGALLGVTGRLSFTEMAERAETGVTASIIYHRARKRESKVITDDDLRPPHNFVTYEGELLARHYFSSAAELAKYASETLGYHLNVGTMLNRRRYAKRPHFIDSDLAKTDNAPKTQVITPPSSMSAEGIKWMQTQITKTVRNINHCKHDCFARASL